MCVRARFATCRRGRLPIAPTCRLRSLEVQSPKKESGVIDETAARPAEAAWLAESAAAPRQSAFRTALAGLIGNVIEWFDFAVYGYFATDIGRQFFPQSSATAQQLLAFTVFALGFVARPIGSVALGVIGDRIGRRSLLTLSVALMGAATLGIGLLPTYEQIGMAAPLLLVILRLAQGFSVGAEFTCSMVYTTELSAPAARGLRPHAGLPSDARHSPLAESATLISFPPCTSRSSSSMKSK